MRQEKAHNIYFYFPPPLLSTLLSSLNKIKCPIWTPPFFFCSFLQSAFFLHFQLSFCRILNLNKMAFKNFILCLQYSLGFITLDFITFPSVLSTCRANLFFLLSDWQKNYALFPLEFSFNTGKAGHSSSLVFLYSLCTH